MRFAQDFGRFRFKMDLNIREMTREEKLRAMHALWEDLAAEEDKVDSPAWHVEALRETENRVEAGEERVWDWAKAKEELRRRAQ